jgi:diacylglycerol kinase
MFHAFHVAFRGLAKAWLQERHLKVHTLAMLAVGTAGWFLKIPRAEFALLILCFGLVLGLEYANSAIERLADRVTLDWDPIIRDAKDFAAAAVLVAALASIAVGILVLGPPLFDLILSL